MQHAQYQVTGWSTVYSGGATGYTQQETVTGTWIYQVQACNASGCSVFRVSAGGVAVTIPPASAPSMIVPATSNTGNYVVDWTGVAGRTYYNLQESVNGGGWTQIYVSHGEVWTASGKSNGNYGYRVQACNEGGCGPWSATKAITVALVPSAPTGVRVVNYTVNKKWEGYEAQWDLVTGATRYEARRTDTGDTVYNNVGNSFVVVEGPRPIDPDEVYDVQVRACNAVGCSGWAP